MKSAPNKKSLSQTGLKNRESKKTIKNYVKSLRKSLTN